MKIDEIKPLNGMVLCKKLEDANETKEHKTKSGIVYLEKQKDNLRDNEYVKFEVLRVSDDIPATFNVGDVIGVDYHSEKGIGIKDVYLVNFHNIKYVKI